MKDFTLHLSSILSSVFLSQYWAFLSEWGKFEKCSIPSPYRSLSLTLMVTNFSNVPFPFSICIKHHQKYQISTCMYMKWSVTCSLSLASSFSPIPFALHTFSSISFPFNIEMDANATEHNSPAHLSESAIWSTE